MKASVIRELLKLTHRKEIISLAGGLPSPAVFPQKQVAEIAAEVSLTHGEVALQYGSTEGYTPLRDAVAERMRSKGIDVTGKDVVITHGSQQGLDLLSKVFLDPHDTIIAEAPSYVGALSSFHAFEGKVLSFPLEPDGLDVEAVDKYMRCLEESDEKKPKFIYTVPTFNNPAGITMSEAKRKRLLEIANEFNLIIIEDNPYGELRYSGDDIPPIKSWDTEGRVVYLGTFSKIFAPGFRLAWLSAEPRILKKIVIAKQSADLCSNTFGQEITSRFIEKGMLEPHIEKIRNLYSKNCVAMLESLDLHFPKEAHWTKPDGGMFIWVTLPENINAQEMFPKALARNVAYVVGHCFFPDDAGHNTLRLNFSHATEDKIRSGIKTLGDVIKAEIAEKGPVQ